jgi:uncharacterized membrane protein
VVKIATFAKPETVSGNPMTTDSANIKRQEMPTAQNGTFGFARHTSQRFAKPKEPFFCNRTDRQKL